MDAILHLAAESPAAAIRLSERVETALSRLGKNPRLGRAPMDERLAGLGYRFLVVEDHLVFYTLAPKLVHRFVHGARDLGRLL